MISEITQWIMELMRAHGQLSVFIGVMIEQIVVPIPSPLIIMGAGAILILPELSIPDAFLQILWIIVLPGHSCLPYLSGLYFCRTLPHFHQTFHPLYLFGLNIPVLAPWVFWMVDRSHLRKGCTRLDSVETITSIFMLIGMGVAFVYLYYRLRKST